MIPFQITNKNIKCLFNKSSVRKLKHFTEGHKGLDQKELLKGRLNFVKLSIPFLLRKFRIQCNPNHITVRLKENRNDKNCRMTLRKNLHTGVFLFLVKKSDEEGQSNVESITYLVNHGEIGQLAMWGGAQRNMQLPTYILNLNKFLVD